MRKHVAFQMDPMETVDIDGDTTFALAETAQARGWTMWEYGPEHLIYDEGKILAFAPVSYTHLTLPTIYSV